MAVFEYTGIAAKGGNKKGIIDAENERVAKSRLKASGIFPTSIKESRVKEVSGDRKKLNLDLFRRG